MDHYCGFVFGRFGSCRGGALALFFLDETQGNSRVNLTELKEGLEEEGFVVLGSYKPAEDSRRKVLSFTHPKLLKVV